MVPILPNMQFPILALLFLLVCAVAALVLRYTVFGEYVYATGGNAEAARLSGLPVRLIVTTVFAISGALAALSGVLLTARLRIGQPTAAQGLELDAIAAVVLGGTSLFGGRGGIIGTVFAVMLLQVLRNVFNLLGLGSFYQMTITGLIIIAAVLLNRAIDNRQGRA
jgi:ribose transport system permease protein